MDDVFGVHVLQAQADLSDIQGHLRLRDFPFLLDLGDRAVGHVLQDEVDVLLIIEEAVEWSQMPVVQEGLDFDLSHQVLLKLVLDDLLLQQFLDRH